MNNSIKKISAISACVLSAAMCLGSLAACKPNDETPEHTAAKAATCTVAGNTEYWVKGGKYYSDEECTKEITKADTVIGALGHDYDSAAYVTTDDDQHWKACARGCGELSTKEDHDYTNGDCVCGKKAPVVEHVAAKEAECEEAGNIEYWKRGNKYYSDANCTTQITQADTVIAATGHNYGKKGVCKCGETGYVTLTVDDAILEKVTAEHTKTSATIGFLGNAALEPDQIVIQSKLGSIEAGRAYEVTYVFESEKAGGHVNFSVDDSSAQYIGEHTVIDIKQGTNTLKFVFVATVAQDGIITANLTPYDTNDLGLTIKSVTSAATTGNFFEGWWLDTNSAASASKPQNESGQITVTATANKESWHLKLAKDVVLENGHEYELTFVVNVNDRVDGNLKYVVYDGKATVQNELCYCDHDGLYVKTFKFTANESCTIGSCLEYGDLSNGSPFTLTVYYVGLQDVTAN